MLSLNVYTHVPLCARRQALVAQLCPALCHPVDCACTRQALLSVGLQAGTLGWVAVPLSGCCVIRIRVQCSDLIWSCTSLRLPALSRTPHCGRVKMGSWWGEKVVLIVMLFHFSFLFFSFVVSHLLKIPFQKLKIV